MARRDHPLVGRSIKDGARGSGDQTKQAPPRAEPEAPGERARQEHERGRSDERLEGREDNEAPIKPQGSEAARHVRFSWTSWRPLAVQAVIPPSRLSMFV